MALGITIRSPYSIDLRGTIGFRVGRLGYVDVELRVWAGDSPRIIAGYTEGVKEV